MNMKMLHPRRWWFPLAFLIGYLSAGIALSIRFIHLNSSSPEAMSWFSLCLGQGAMGFPIGIPGCVVWSGDFFRRYAPDIIAWGWIAYALITIAGLIRPYRSLFVLLVVLLILNISGCQLEHVLSNIP